MNNDYYHFSDLCQYSLSLLIYTLSQVGQVHEMSIGLSHGDEFLGRHGVDSL